MPTNMATLTGTIIYKDLDLGLNGLSEGGLFGYPLFVFSCHREKCCQHLSYVRPAIPRQQPLSIRPGI
jgi:hypothetical protein